MSIKQRLSRIASTLAAMLQTRLELVSVELEEELLRFSSYFVFALVALFCAGVAVALAIILILAIFWDNHRIEVLLCMIGVFGIASLLIGMWLRNQLRNKPRLLQHTIAELKKDAELLNRNDPANPETEQS
jgi:uncharacterized membrane protein YqjE